MTAGDGVERVTGEEKSGRYHGLVHRSIDLLCMICMIRRLLYYYGGATGRQA